MEITEEKVNRILQFKTTPINSGKYVCLDLPTEAGPMVEAEEFAALVRIAKRLDRLTRKFWATEGKITEGMKEMRWHLARQTLTDAIEARIDRRIAKRYAEMREIGKRSEAVRDAMLALISTSRTLQPLVR